MRRIQGDLIPDRIRIPPVGIRLRAVSRMFLNEG